MFEVLDKMISDTNNYNRYINTDIVWDYFYKIIIILHLYGYTYIIVYIDEDQLFGDLLSSDEEKVAEYKQWEDFASVATNLLEWLDELLEGRFDNI